jgi:hypothetical protein
MTEQTSRPTKPHNPAEVDYGSIVTQLQKAARVRRQQLIQTTGPIVTVADIMDYYAVGVKGAPMTGGQRYALQRFTSDPEHTIVITATQREATDFALAVSKKKGQSKTDPLPTRTGPLPTRRVLCARDVIAIINQFSPNAREDQERTVLKIELDVNDHNPAATMVAIHDEYVRRLEELRSKVLDPSNPLYSVKTIVVERASRCEAQGINSARLFRFGRLGGKTPEFILLD